jgi:hypothetical protein
MARWALFKGRGWDNGNLRCKEFDDGILLYSREVPARPMKRSFFGNIKDHGRSAYIEYQYQFDPKVYSPDNFCASAFKVPTGTGWRFCENRGYLKENRWGSVDVLAFLPEDVGKQIESYLDELNPYGD